MDIWVKDLETGEKWILDEDQSRKVYQKDGSTVFKLCEISSFRFYPCDPDAPEKHCHEIEMASEGYQFDIMDYLEV